MNSDSERISFFGSRKGKLAQKLDRGQGAVGRLLTQMSPRSCLILSWNPYSPMSGFNLTACQSVLTTSNPRCCMLPFAARHEALPSTGGFDQCKRASHMARLLGYAISSKGVPRDLCYPRFV